MYYPSIWLVLADFMSITGGKHDGPQSISDQPQKGESTFGDSSGVLFSMYSKAAEDEDEKMVEGWQKDADGILIFVSPSVRIHIILCMNWNVIDWSILCCSRCTPFYDRRGPDAKQSGYLSILSWEHL
jgi:hypothetical protein